jgi:polyhydroxyalkanoate synthesis regulator phasin
MDATKNMINSQKKHQVPEKTKEQLEQEAFMNSPITRQEAVDYVQQTFASVTMSFNTIFGIFQKTLVDKGLITLEDLEAVTDEILNDKKEQSEKAKKEPSSENGEELKKDAAEHDPTPKPKDKEKKHK